MFTIGPFQEEVLRAVHTLDLEAYGMNIRDFLEEEEKKAIHMPQVYAALSRLEALGLVVSELDSQGSAGRRGRTRRVYQLNAHGLQYLSRRGRLSHGAGAKKDPYPLEGTAQTAATA